MIGDPETLLGRAGIGDAVERLRAAIEPARAVPGWATVELDRAERDVAQALSALGRVRAERRPDDALLGASCRLLRFGSGRDILLLEPSTEGRLAASLVRFGEGSVALYLLAAPDAPERARGAGFEVSRRAAGPLGAELLVVGGPPWGPHLLLVPTEPPPVETAPPATIEA
jgi:hypothetical protein